MPEPTTGITARRMGSDIVREARKAVQRGKEWERPCRTGICQGEGDSDGAESTAGACLKRKHAHRKVLSQGNCASVIENGQKIPAETTGLRYKNVYLVNRTQKWMGSVCCFGHNKNKKRQSLEYRVVIRPGY